MPFRFSDDYVLQVRPNSPLRQSRGLILRAASLDRGTIPSSTQTRRSGSLKSSRSDSDKRLWSFKDIGHSRCSKHVVKNVDLITKSLKNKPNNYSKYNNIKHNVINIDNKVEQIKDSVVNENFINNSSKKFGLQHENCIDQDELHPKHDEHYQGLSLDSDNRLKYKKKDENNTFESKRRLDNNLFNDNVNFKGESIEKGIQTDINNRDDNGCNQTREIRDVGNGRENVNEIVRSRLEDCEILLVIILIYGNFYFDIILVLR